jgi:hypothetical protein
MAPLLREAGSSAVSHEGQHVGARQFNDRERPRTLLWGLSPGLANNLKTVLPEAEVIGWAGAAFENDFDLLISSNRSLDGIAPHLFVVALGDGSLGRLPDGRAITRTSTIPTGHSHQELCVAREFKAPDELPPEFDELVASDLVPQVKAQRTHSGMAVVPGYSKDISGVTRLLQASDGTVLAGQFRRSEDGGWCLSLPPEADVVAWAKAAINVWHGVDQKRFPGRLDWTDQSREWDPPVVLTAAERHGEAAAALYAAQKAEVVALDGFGEAKAEAAAGPFGMLTQAGDSLVAAVAAALSDLGLEVRDMDREWPEGKRLEDLRVKTPDDAGWEAIVEIKGYSRGYGKAADLVSIAARFAKAYRLSEKREPSALWYVVNQEPNVDPGPRKMILDSSNADIEVFADSDGLAIGTVDLYRLWRDVQQGKLTAEVARQYLTHSRGRFAYAWATETEAPVGGTA